MATCRIENLHFYGFCRFIIVCSFKSLLRDLWFCSLDIIVQMLFMNRYFFLLGLLKGEIVGVNGVLVKVRAPAHTLACGESY